MCHCISLPKNVYHIVCNYLSGVRSVSFQEEIITIGTGVGQILFFDLKAGRYLESGCGHSCTLDLSKGWLVSTVKHLAPR